VQNRGRLRSPAVAAEGAVRPEDGSEAAAEPVGDEAGPLLPDMRICWDEAELAVLGGDSRTMFRNAGPRVRAAAALLPAAAAGPTCVAFFDRPGGGVAEPAWTPLRPTENWFRMHRGEVVAELPRLAAGLSGCGAARAGAGAGASTEAVVDGDADRDAAFGPSGSAAAPMPNLVVVHESDTSRLPALAAFSAAAAAARPPLLADGPPGAGSLAGGRAEGAPGPAAVVFVVSHAWVLACVEAGALLPVDDFLLCDVLDARGQRLLAARPPAAADSVEEAEL